MQRQARLTDTEERRQELARDPWMGPKPIDKMIAEVKRGRVLGLDIQQYYFERQVGSWPELLPEETKLLRECDMNLEAAATSPLGEEGLAETLGYLEKAKKCREQVVDSLKGKRNPAAEILELRDDAVKTLAGLLRSTARAFTPVSTKTALDGIEKRCLHKKEQTMLSNLKAAVGRSKKRGDAGLDAWAQAKEELQMLHEEIKRAPTAPKGGKKASLHAKLVRLAHAHPEFRDHLMPLVLAPIVTFGKAAADKTPTPWRGDGVVEDLHAELYKLADEHRLNNGRAPDGTGALEYQIRFLRASLKKSLPWIYDSIVLSAESAMAQSPELSPVAKKVIKEAKARRKEWDTAHAAELAKRTHA